MKIADSSFRTLLLLLISAQACCAGTFTVTTTDDSGPGSLRQAILDANSLPGPDRIEFNLPGTGVHTIAPWSALPTITGPVTIDGYSQPGGQPNTQQWGSDALLLVRLDGINATNAMTAGLTLSAGNCTVRGLIIVRFNSGIEVEGSSNVIAGNWVGIDFDGVARGNRFEGINVSGMGFVPVMYNRIGGESYADRNVISGNSTGISFFPELASYNSVIGNYIGTDPSGRLRRGNVFEGVSVQAATNIQVLGNVLAASTGAGGSGVHLLGTSGIVVQRNLIGLSVDMGDLGNFGDGIFAQGVNGLQIGGAGDTDGNRIGCNGGNGIELLACSGAVIRQNLIGTASSGAEPLGNLRCGILLNNCNTNTIGPANQLVYNGRAGVSVSSGIANEITANYIYDNGGLGIDLGDNGLTPNDPGDLDTGANELQNFPVLTAAQVRSGSVGIKGTLQSQPATVYRLEFFGSRPWDPYWIPEGQVYLGSMSVTTDPAGNADFAFSCPDPGWFTDQDVVTATATDPFGNTSEFSSSGAVSVEPRPPVLSISRTGSDVTVSWPNSATAAGFQLESSVALGEDAVWQAENTTVTDNGVTSSVVLSALTPGRFFRLRK